MAYAIGVDIGGTKISMVIGSRKGKIIARREIPTQVRKKSRLCVKQLVQELKLLIKESPISKKKILGIGVCIPGAVDSKKGVVPHSPNLPGWDGIHLKRILKQNLKLRVVLANDANAAAVGERIFGEAQNFEDFIYMTISTGVGGGIFIDGQLLEGKNFVAGEVGHMAVVAGGDLCNCGRKGCLEAYSSGTAIARYVSKEIRRGKPAGILKYVQKNNVTTKDISRAARAKNPLALKAFKRAGHYLGEGIANLLNILNSQVIILGGGVMKSAPPIFWKALRESGKASSWPEAWKAVRIVKTKLGDQVGNLGSLALVFNQFKK